MNFKLINILRVVEISSFNTKQTLLLFPLHKRSINAILVIAPVKEIVQVAYYFYQGTQHRTFRTPQCETNSQFYFYVISHSFWSK